MSTKVMEQKLNMLTEEVAQLRSLVFAVIEKDPEGEYRPAFAKSVLKAMKEPAPHAFTGGKNFLKLLQTK